MKNVLPGNEITKVSNTKQTTCSQCVGSTHLFKCTFHVLFLLEIGGSVKNHLFYCSKIL